MKPPPARAYLPGVIMWTCMVCGKWRDDELISVAKRKPPFPVADIFPGAITVNVRYCNDSPSCAAFAHSSGPWRGSPESESRGQGAPVNSS